MDYLEDSHIPASRYIEDQTKHRWRIKDTLFSAWADLPGRYTLGEIWRLMEASDFSVAQPVKEEIGCKASVIAGRGSESRLDSNAATGMRGAVRK